MMNVVSLSPETYRSVETYAKSRNLSVDDAANSIILGYISVVNPVSELKDQNTKNVKGFLSLKGILKNSDTNMSDKDLIDEYLKDKFGV